MNLKILSIIIIYLFFTFYFINVFTNYNTIKNLVNNTDNIENFDSKNNSDKIENYDNDDNINDNINEISDNDDLDKTYTKLYDVVFNEDEMFKYETNLILKFAKNNFKNKNTKSIKILDAGSGAGKHYYYLNKYFDTYGLEKSKNMIQRSFIKNPINNIKNGNLRKDTYYNQGEFDLIVCFKDTLYHNSIKDWDDIISNFYYWLKPNGYLVIHVFDKNKLDPTPRNHSQYVYDKNKIKHAITHFKKFVHDGWWEKKSNNLYAYNEIVAFRTKYKDKYKKKSFRHLLNFPDKNNILKILEKYYFKLEQIDRLNKIEIYDHEIYYLKKPMKKLNIYND